MSIIITTTRNKANNYNNEASKNFEISSSCIDNGDGDGDGDGDDDTSATSSTSSNNNNKTSLLSDNDSDECDFVLEKLPRNSGFGSKDPLFQAEYLYEGSMTTKQIQTYSTKFCRDGCSGISDKKNFNNKRNRAVVVDTDDSSTSSGSSSSWTMPSFLNIFSTSPTRN
jgi:hypothetical protein